MSIEEIRTDVLKDYPILYRKMKYHEEQLFSELHRHKIPNNYVGYFDYTSKQKNHWVYRLEINKKTFYHQAMVFYHTGKGYVGIIVASNNYLLFHTAHMFNRYNERRQLGLLKFFDIIRVFMNDNFDYTLQTLEKISQGVSTFFCECNTGVMIGTINEKLKLVKFNTYLPQNMLFPEQKNLLEQLKESSVIYIPTAGDIHK
jgi:hypothetical protein